MVFASDKVGIAQRSPAPRGAAADTRGTHSPSPTSARLQARKGRQTKHYGVSEQEENPRHIISLLQMGTVSGAFFRKAAVWGACGCLASADTH